VRVVIDLPALLGSRRELVPTPLKREWALNSNRDNRDCEFDVIPAARRWIGIVGLSSGALFTLLATLSPSKVATLLLLCLSFAGISFNQSMTFPICIDVAKKFPGSMGGAMNMAAQVGSFLSGVVFGYVAKISGSYDQPLIVMAFVLASGALLWLKIDPTKELVPEDQQELGTALLSTRD